MKKVLLMFITILLTIQVRSQTNGKVQVLGRVYDSNSSSVLSGASIACLKAQDSTKVRSTFTDKAGYFVIDSLHPGNYFLTVRYLGYRESSHLINTSGVTNSINLGIIELQRVGLDLAPIEIKEGRNQVKIKRDTIEYNASNFKTRPNATVEDLLKKLPGVEVGDDGSITINGEITKQILIDGRLFFIDDPMLVSRYILSEMVDKVQLINRKKDQFQSKDINGKRTEKIINITIRDDRRNEITGQVSTSYGVNSKFASKISLGRFNRKQQIGIFITGDNVNGLQDGKISTNDGFIESWKGGGNYSEDLGKKVTIYSSYLIDKSRKEYQKKSTQQNLLLDSNYYEVWDQSTYYSTNQIANVKLDYRIDSFQTLSFTNLFNYQNGSNIQNDSFKMADKGTKVLNSGLVKRSNDASIYNLLTTVLFAKKFKKDGRLLNMGLVYGSYGLKSVDHNISMSEYNQYNRESRSDTINQKRSTLNENEFLQFSFAYTEPIIKTHLLTFTYILSHTNSPSNLPVYDYNANTRDYDVKNDSLSNRFSSKLLYHYLGLGISTSKKKYDYNVSLFANIVNMRNDNLSKVGSVSLRKVIVVPNISFNYYFDQRRQLGVSYVITVEMPDVSQLQPVVDNSNPLYIQLGNQSLNPMRIHAASISYISINAKSLRNLSIILGGEYVTGKIINGTSIDTLGRQINQPINRDGAYAVKIGIDNGYPLGKRSTIKLSTVLGLNRDVNYLNGKGGFCYNRSAMQAVSFRSSYNEIFDITTSTNVSYNSLKYTNNENGDSKFLTYKVSFDWNINIPLGIVVGGNIKYILSTGRIAGYNPNALVLNAYVSKSLLNTKQLVVKIQGFDLTNSNTNYNRSISDSYITDTYSIGLQRLFLLNLTYYIKKRKSSGK